MSSTGQWVGAVVGGVIGFVVTGGNPYGAVKGAAYGAALGGYIDPPPGPDIKLPSVDDKKFQSSAYGVGIAKTYGSIALSGNVIYLENNKYKRVIKKNKTGGKGGAPEGSYETETYFATFAVSLCEARPGSRIRRLWLGGELFYNADSDDLGTVVESARRQYQPFTGNMQGSGRGMFVYYDGSQSEPDPRIESVMGIGNAPSYEGTAYVMFYDLDLTLYGNGLQGCPIKAEIVGGTGVEQIEFLRSWGADSDEGVSPPDVYGYVWGFGLGGITNSDDYFVKRSGLPFNVLDASGSPISSLRLIQDPREFDAGLSAGVGEEFVTIPSFDETMVGFGWKKTFGPSDTHFYRAGSLCLFNDKNDFSGGGLAPEPDGPAEEAETVGLGAWMCSWARQGGGCVVGRSDPTAGGFAWDGFGIYSASGDVVLVKNFGSYTQCKIFVGDGLVFCIYQKMGDESYFETYDHSGNFLIDGSLGLNVDNGRIFGVISQGKFYLPVDSAGNIISKVAVVSANTGSVIEIIELPNSVYTQVSDFACTMVARINDLLIFSDTIGRRVAAFLFKGAGVESEYLINIVSDIYKKAGFTDDELDLSALNGILVQGYKLPGVGAARGFIAPLQVGYFFDMVEDGYKLRAVLRGGSTIGQIAFNNLVFNGSAAVVETEKQMTQQLPSRYSLTYIDYNREYEDGIQHADYPSIHVNERSEQLAIVMPADNAAKVVDVLINSSHTERDKFKFRLPQNYLGVCPADLYELEVSPGRFVTVRFESITWQSAQIVDVVAVRSSPTIFNSSAVGFESVPPPETVTYIAAARVQLLDIPMITAAQNQPCFVAVMWGAGDWPGGSLFASVDSEQTFNSIQGFSGAGTLGSCLNAINVDDCFVIDRSSELIVNVISGDFFSITESQMMTGNHYCAYGANGRWEICQYANAELIGDGKVKLSVFVRGLFGTENYSGLHVDGDYFVLLDDSDNAIVNLSVSDINVPKYYRPVTYGLSVQDAASTLFSYEAVNLKPLPVVQIKGERPASDWLISFMPRTRYPSSVWLTGIEPENEAGDRFEIDILDGTDVVRTITVFGGSAIYSEAEQVADFGYVKSVLSLVIYHVSPAVGRGYPSAQTIGEALPLGIINFLMLDGGGPIQGNQIEFIVG